ncbi:MAG: flippase-like domain-containing protein [Prevotellaceae bacterium]|jgi:hypothetical protein|nr:flippase-like domain-containing protein [Prevotellaceae bacterium]
MDFLKTRYSVLKWLVLVAAYGYLAYLLLSYDGYGDLWLQWSRSFAANWGWLLLALLLVPVNWVLEAKKWQILLRGVEDLSLHSSLRAVLGGNTAAFFTPNRLGEFPGRSVFLNRGNRVHGMLLGLYSAFSQTLVILLAGIPCVLLLFGQSSTKFWHYELAATLIFFVLLGVYLVLPKIFRKISTINYLKKYRRLLLALSSLKHTKLLAVCGVALLRYGVFCTQFYLLLRFFGVPLTAWQGVTGIASYYLFVTFTPSFAFSEGAVRASYAVVVLGMFSGNTVGIATAGVVVWLVNFVLPMLGGSYFFAKTTI